MKITGTMINYYFHCKRQCYLFANKFNLEDNSEDVRIGRIIHEIKAFDNNKAEVKFENISLDKIDKNYVTELKKSDSDVEAGKMQLLFYLKILKNKGIFRKGKIKFYESKNNLKTEEIILDEITEGKLVEIEKDIEKLIMSDKAPDTINKPNCKKCAYYDYCYI